MNLISILPKLKEIMVNYYNIPVVPGIDDGNAQEEECTCEKVHWVTDPAFFGQSEVLDCLL